MQKEKNNFKLIILFIVIFLLGFFWGGYFFQSFQIKLFEDAKFLPFFESWVQVKEKFYGYSPQKEKEMIYGAIDGMVKGLGDPYSDFLTPQETSLLETELEGEYEGIGAEIGVRDGKITIISPLKNTPAEKAGILSGDIILEVDGKDTSQMTLTEVVMKIRGKAGEIVKLKLKRGQKVLDIKIKRAKIEIPVVEYKILNNNIGYIRIFNFYGNTYSKFQEASEEILKRGTNKIILDLRDNPGGFLESAVDVGGFFVQKNRLILKQDFGHGKVDEIKSSGPGSFSNFKTVVLINEGSASASEILAGAIKENNKDNVVLVGEKTFGKGTVQEMVSLKDNSALKITVAHWLLPSGKFIDKQGIKPDKEIKMDEDKAKSDIQLQAAIGILSK